jgi:predicted RNase H-like HicB family nuclease
MKVCVIYERSETGWSAYPPGIGGVAAAGRSVAEVRENVKRAIEMHIADMSFDELVELDTPGESAELLDIGPAIAEEAHRELLRRQGVNV